MRLAFWRAGKDKPVVQRAMAKACAFGRRSPSPHPNPAISICMRSARR